MIYDIIIVGAGITGLSAAVYCGRLNLNALVLGKEFGGIIAGADAVENYPGFNSISGFELVKRISEQAKDSKIQIKNENVAEIKKDKVGFSVKTEKSKYQAKTILFCTGSQWKKLNVSGEKEFAGRGVHYCALCDAPIYRDKIVAVAGSGDSAVKEALLIAKFAKKVYIVARHNLKAEPINIEKVQKEPKIEIIVQTEIKEIKGARFTELIKLSKKHNGSNSLKVDGIFVVIGHEPNSQLAKSLGVKLNKSKEIVTDKESKTNIKGIFAAGDVADAKFKQAITGVGEAVKGVYSAYEHLKHKKFLE